MKQLRFTCMANGLLGVLGMPAVTKDEVDAHRPMTEKRPVGEPLRSKIRMHESMEPNVPSLQPTFIDGDFGQFDAPVEEQDVLMLLPEGKTMKCKVTPSPENDDAYIISEFDYVFNSEPVTAESSSETTEKE